jgi:hypothetical protein
MGASVPQDRCFCKKTRLSSAKPLRADGQLQCDLDADCDHQPHAGDVTTPGGQDVFVGNYTTNASNQICGVGAETSFTVIL